MWSVAHHWGNSGQRNAALFHVRILQNPAGDQNCPDCGRGSPATLGISSADESPALMRYSASWLHLENNTVTVLNTPRTLHFLWESIAEIQNEQSTSSELEWQQKKLAGHLCCLLHTCTSVSCMCQIYFADWMYFPAVIGTLWIWCIMWIQYTLLLWLVSPNDYTVR